MELFRNFVITLITSLIFIAAIEIIIPQNGMKKYINFVLGLILIAVILNPILKILNLDERGISKNVNKFLLTKGEKEKEEKKENIYSSENFRKNLNNNIKRILESEFKSFSFEPKVECFINFQNLQYKINKLDIYIKEKDKLVKKIKKVQLNKDIEKEENVNSFYKDIIKFISNELMIDEKIINIYNDYKER